MSNSSTDDFASLRVGLCQIETEPWAVEDNFRRTVSALRDAATRGAELLITPECVLHGYAFDKKDDLPARVAAVAEPLDGARIGAVCRLARELDVDVVLGFAEKGEAGRIHNSAALIGREGRIVFVYRKVHCRTFESADYGSVFTPGDQFFVASRRYRQGEFRIGAFICFDREIVESARCLRSLGSHFIACPLATDTFDPYAREQVNNEIITRCRAAENEMCIAVVNHARRFNGGTFAVGAMGEVLCQLGKEAEVCVIDVPVGRAVQLQSNAHGWMGWGYRRADIYQNYLDTPSSQPL